MKNIKFLCKNNPEVRKLLKISNFPKNIGFEREEEDVINSELERNKDMLQERVYPNGVMENDSERFSS